MANQQVHDAECVLNSLAKAPRSIYKVDGLPEKDLTLNLYDRTVNASPVIFTEYTTFPWRAFWVEAPPSQPAAPVEAAPTAFEVAAGEEEAAAATASAAPKRKYSAAAIAAIRKSRAMKAVAAPGQ